MPEFVRLRRTQAAPTGLRAQVAVPTLPASHRRIELLTLALLWLLVLEGALRKWVAPSWASSLFFVRDPVLLLLYVEALRARALHNAGPLFVAGGLLALAALPLSLLQALSFNDARMLPVLGYGWRQYFLYLPLPFILAATLDRLSVQRLMRHVLLVLLWVAPLVLVQRLLPATAVLNRGIADDPTLQFQAFAFTGGSFRPAGPFTTNAGLKELIAASSAVVLAFWLMRPADRGVGRALLLASTLALGCCLAVSASRAAFVHVGLVVMTGLAIALLTRQQDLRRRALMLPTLLVVCGALLYPLFFPDALDAMLARFIEAHAVESRQSLFGLLGRALADYTDFHRVMGASPLQGYGLGLGGNGRTFVAAAGALVPQGVPYAESDWTRHIVDLGPLLGLLFIIYRIAFTGAAMRGVLQATRQAANPVPLLLFGYVGIGLLNGQLTGQGTVGGFIWLFLGLCLAATRNVAARSR